MSRHKQSLIDDTALLNEIQNCVLFSGLTDSQFKLIYSTANSKELSEGDILFTQEQPSTEFFLLVAGQIKLTRNSIDGNEKIIDLIAPGMSFGEAIMFAKQPVYPVSATALMKSQIICFNSNTYMDILHESNEACFAIMAQMSRRLHGHINEIDRLTLHSATFRVICYLIDQLPSTTLGASEVKLDTAKHIIAARLSITPETLSRSFSKLHHEGLITVHDHSVTLNDVDKLRNIIQQGSL